MRRGTLSTRVCQINNYSQACPFATWPPNHQRLVWHYDFLSEAMRRAQSLRALGKGIPNVLAPAFRALPLPSRRLYVSILVSCPLGLGSECFIPPPSLPGLQF